MYSLAMSGQTGWKVDTNLTQVVKSNFSAVICAHLCWLAKKNSHSVACKFELVQSECGSSQAITSTRKTKKNFRKHATLFGQDLQRKLVVFLKTLMCLFCANMDLGNKLIPLCAKKQKFQLPSVFYWPIDV